MPSEKKDGKKRKAADRPAADATQKPKKRKKGKEDKQAEPEAPQRPWDADTHRDDLPISRMARKSMKTLGLKTVREAAAIPRGEWIDMGLSPLAFAEVQMMAAESGVKAGDDEIDQALLGEPRQVIAALVRRVAERDAVVGNDIEQGFDAIANGDPALRGLRLLQGTLRPAYREAYEKARGQMNHQ